MKCKAIVFVFFLSLSVCVFAQEKKQSVSRVEETGAIQVTINARGYGSMNEKDWSAALYNSTWQYVTGIARPSGCDQQSYTFTMTAPIGNYFVGAFARWETDYHTGFPSPMGDAWLNEYYNNAHTQGKATLVSIKAADTTRITMTLDSTTFIMMATNPKPFQFFVDGTAYTALPSAYLPTFKWRKSDVHQISVNESYPDETYPERVRYSFREWSQGGGRIQNYTVPRPKFYRVVDTLAARFDTQYYLQVRSKYGHPEGTGWHNAWKNVTFSVEDSVIQYSDSTGAFPKIAKSVKKDSILHVFEKWEGAGHEAYSGKNNPATMLLNGNDVIETARWKDRLPLAAQSNDTLMGTVSVNPKGIWQDKDSTVVLKAVPKKGFVFVKWEGSVKDTAGSISVKMDTSKTVTAKFAPSGGTIQVKVIAKGLSGGEEKIWSAALYNSSWQKVTGLTTPGGIHQEEWTYETNVAVGNYYIEAGAYIEGRFSNYFPWLDEYYDNAHTKDKAKIVSVKESDTTRVTIPLDSTSFILVATNPKPFPFTVDGTAYTVSKIFAWRKSDVHQIGVNETYPDETNAQCVRYLFREWSQGGSRNQNYVVPSPVFDRTADTLAARFEKQYYLTVQSNDSLMGTVSANPKGPWQYKDSTVVLKAVPKKGFVFVRWEDAVSDTARNISVRMDTSKTITAKFAPSTGVQVKRHTETGMPKSFFLYQNYPNPFNPSTEIRFDVPERKRVRLELYTLIGIRLKTLADAEYDAGSYSVTWNGTDENGRKVGSGIYLYRMSAGDYSKICKLNLIK